MQHNFPRAYAFTRAQEGLWEDNPADPAGCTMQGVPLGKYRDWCAKQGLPEPTPDDLRNISDATLEAIYGEYWADVNGDGLPDGVDLSVFDAGFDTGPGTAAEQLQRILRVVADGVVGPITCAAAGRTSPFALLANLADAQETYYRALPRFPTFGAGWIARAQRRRSAAMALASGRGG